MAIGNGKNVRRQTDEEGNKRGVSMDRSKAGTKEISLDGLSLPNQNTMLKNIMCYYFTKYVKSTMKFNEQKTKWT